ncbi:MAG: M48 family metallopeptidase [Candidatus Obscuribacterales bacterium]|nr:M48 family metallopeptidase [Candidatus Obscuribacterales bacterium]
MTYQARLYTPKSGDFEVVTVRVAKQTLYITDNNGDRTVDLGEFELQLTGQEGDKVRLDHAQSGISILCTDRKLLDDLHEQGGEFGIAQKAKKAKLDLKVLPVKKWGFLIGSVTTVIVAGMIFYFTFDVWVNMAIAHIPRSAEESIGKLGIKEAELDNKSENWKRVDAIGQKLVSHLKNNPYKFRFYIKDKDELNAFALPGGSIIVLSKLVKDAKNDDEIAGLLGHEIGHVVHRDTLRHLLRHGGLGLCLAIISGGMINNDQIAQLIPALQMIDNLNYSRGQEAAADLMGIRLSLSSGYNGEEMINFFQRLEKDEPKVGKEALALLSDHPMTSDRITAIHAEAAVVRRLLKAKKVIDKDIQ